MPRSHSAYLVFGLVRGHVVVVRAGLEEQSLGDEVVVGRVASVIPVVDQLSEHGTCLPPEVRLGQVARYLAGLVAIVVCDELVGDRAGSRLDAVFEMLALVQEGPRAGQSLCRTWAVGVESNALGVDEGRDAAHGRQGGEAVEEKHYHGNNGQSECDE